MNGLNQAPINIDDEDTILSIPRLDPYQYQRLFNPTRRGSKRQKTMHNRIDWHKHVVEKINNGTFTMRYRMTYQTFVKLVDLLDITVDELLSGRSTSGNPPIIKELFVAAGISYLSGSRTCDLARSL